MTKTQKIWMGIFLAMFLVPEVLFLNIIYFSAYFLGGSIVMPISLMLGANYTVSSFFFLLALAVEIVGTIGLSVLSIKANKKVAAVLFMIISIWLIFIFCFIKAFSQFSL